MSFGSGAMSNSIDELEHIKMALIIGSNTTEAHPVMANHIKRAVLKGARLVVADPRRIDMAQFAELYLPLKVGTDVALLNAMMHVIIKEDLHDKKFIENCTEDFELLKKKVQEYTPEHAAKITGLPKDDIVKAARMFSSVKPASLIYTLGITEHSCGVDNVLSCANLQMLLGNMGVENGGVNPLRGQNNVQGACDMGCLPNVYSGYQKIQDDAARKKFEDYWKVSLPSNIGLTTPKMLKGMLDGSFKALYFMGENLVMSEPHMANTRKCLESAEFLVSNDIFMTESTQYAHVVFPATAWCEDDGTYSNSERRINRVRKAVEAPDGARHDWWICQEIAKRMGSDLGFKSAHDMWDNEISVISPNFAGIKYSRIENDGLQWPCPTLEHPGTKFLHKDGKFTRGKGKFHAVDWRAPAEVPDDKYPFMLTTGRRLYHYHTRTQTGRCEGLDTLLPEEFLELNPLDAAKLGVIDGQRVKVESRRGKIELKALVTEKVQPGLVFMAFHFAEANANVLTNNVYDPVSDTAEYKASAVKITPVAAKGANAGAEGIPKKIKVGAGKDRS
jgi:formate dehydrogenase major subunit